MSIAVDLNANSQVPLYKQVYEGVKNLILNGKLSPGERIPSTRELASMLSISRTTATLAYEMLAAEGYIDTTRASRTFVRSELPESFLQTKSHVKSRTGKRRAKSPVSRLSNYGATLAAEPETSQRMAPTEENLHRLRGRELLNVSSNAPSIRDFPLSDWRRAINSALRNGAHSLYEYATHEGCLPLRHALARYLNLSRGVNCNWNQVIVTSGSKQALDLIARMHLNAQDAVGMEEPGYPAARRAFQACGARVFPLPIDDSGLAPQNIDGIGKELKLIYTTPSHQYPTGVVMPVARRIALIQSCELAGALLIEDDYDSEFRYSARPISALQGLAEAGSVVYAGTLSKVMFPSLRLGYIVVPTELSRHYELAQESLYGHPSTVSQAATALFMEWGVLEKHIRRMRLLYSQRHDFAIEQFNKHFGSDATMIGDASGLHFIFRLPPELRTEAFVETCAKMGLEVRTTRNCYAATPGKLRTNEFIFGFGRLTEPEISSSITTMMRAYKSVLRKR